MIGYHAASLIADSYVKGYRNFDVQEAYKACLRTAEYDTTGIVTSFGCAASDAAGQVLEEQDWLRALRSRQ